MEGWSEGGEAEEDEVVDGIAMDKQRRRGLVDNAKFVMIVVMREVEEQGEKKKDIQGRRRI